MFEGQKEEGGKRMARLDDRAAVPTLQGQVIKQCDKCWTQQASVCADSFLVLSFAEVLEPACTGEVLGIITEYFPLWTS